MTASGQPLVAERFVKSQHAQLAVGPFERQGASGPSPVRPPRKLRVLQWQVQSIHEARAEREHFNGRHVHAVRVLVSESHRS